MENLMQQRWKMNDGESNAAQKSFIVVAVFTVY